MAAREGGDDPVGNFRLRLAIQKAREVNMPADNIERAIQRGAGGKDGVKLEEVRYEGYGPHGVAVMLDVLTDNRNRTVAAIRNLFTRSGGSLGEANSVAWMFSNQGIIRDRGRCARPRGDRPGAARPARRGRRRGHQPSTGTSVQVSLAPHLFEEARRRLEEAGYTVEAAEVTMNPGTSITLDAPQARQVLRLLDSLEDLDDVQQVYANAEIPDEVLKVGHVVAAS